MHLKTNTEDYRKYKIYSKLISNHDRVTKLFDVQLVKYAFLLSDPEGKQSLFDNESILHAKHLKKFIRLYLNKYRKRTSGKNVVGYSWVLQTEAYRGIPYLHILFYLKAEMYNKDMPIHIPTGLPFERFAYAFLDDNEKREQQKAYGECLSVISDLGWYWTHICSQNGFEGTCVSYNLDKDRVLLSHGNHRYIERLKDFGDLYPDINGSSFIQNKLCSVINDRASVNGYFHYLANEAYFLPRERSYGTSRPQYTF
ncbi:hypothetical protein AB7Y92_20615 [Providencia manganoxydans]|uniref:hypothetical protein n=1 Tax=Providencia manganoxydans TaxID=2923283 RepID=UPI0034E4F9EC